MLVPPEAPGTTPFQAQCATLKHWQLPHVSCPLKQFQTSLKGHRSAQKMGESIVHQPIGQAVGLESFWLQSLISPACAPPARRPKGISSTLNGPIPSLGPTVGKQGSLGRNRQFPVLGQMPDMTSLVVTRATGPWWSKGETWPQGSMWESQESSVSTAGIPSDPQSPPPPTATSQPAALSHRQTICLGLHSCPDTI